MVDGDEIMAICANYMKEKGSLKQDTVVVTVMSNLGFTLMGQEKNLHIEKTKVGDRYVLENMLANGYNLGGEQSGHVIFLDDNTTGDGLLSALHLLPGHGGYRQAIIGTCQGDGSPTTGTGERQGA